MGHESDAYLMSNKLIRHLWGWWPYGRCVPDTYKPYTSSPYAVTWCVVSIYSDMICRHHIHSDMMCRHHIRWPLTIWRPPLLIIGSLDPRPPRISPCGSECGFCLLVSFWRKKFFVVNFILTLSQIKISYLNLEKEFLTPKAGPESKANFWAARRNPSELRIQWRELHFSTLFNFFNGSTFSPQIGFRLMIHIKNKYFLSPALPTQEAVNHMSKFHFFNITQDFSWLAIIYLFFSWSVSIIFFSFHFSMSSSLPTKKERDPHSKSLRLEKARPKWVDFKRCHPLNASISKDVAP